MVKRIRAVSVAALVVLAGLFGVSHRCFYQIQEDLIMVEDLRTVLAAAFVVLAAFFGLYVLLWAL